VCRGKHGVFRSCFLPISCPAWSSLCLIIPSPSRSCCENISPKLTSGSWIANWRNWYRGFAEWREGKISSGELNYRVHQYGTPSPRRNLGEHPSFHFQSKRSGKENVDDQSEGRIEYPSLSAASHRFPSRQTNSRPRGDSWPHMRAAPSCKASAALRGWTEKSRSALSRTLSVG